MGGGKSLQGLLLAVLHLKFPSHWEGGVSPASLGCSLSDPDMLALSHFKVSFWMCTGKGGKPERVPWGQEEQRAQQCFLPRSQASHLWEAAVTAPGLPGPSNLGHPVQPEVWVVSGDASPLLYAALRWVPRSFEKAHGLLRTEPRLGSSALKCH